MKVNTYNLTLTDADGTVLETFKVADGDTDDPECYNLRCLPEH